MESKGTFKDNKDETKKGEQKTDIQGKARRKTNPW
jgi:hypothetical protein